MRRSIVAAAILAAIASSSARASELDASTCKTMARAIVKAAAQRLHMPAPTESEAGDAIDFTFRRPHIALYYEVNSQMSDPCGTILWARSFGSLEPTEALKLLASEVAAAALHAKTSDIQELMAKCVRTQPPKFEVDHQRMGYKQNGQGITVECNAQISGDGGPEFDTTIYVQDADEFYDVSAAKLDKKPQCAIDALDRLAKWAARHTELDFRESMGVRDDDASAGVSFSTQGLTLVARCDGGAMAQADAARVTPAQLAMLRDGLAGAAGRDLSAAEVTAFAACLGSVSSQWTVKGERRGKEAPAGDFVAKCGYDKRQANITFDLELAKATQ